MSVQAVRGLQDGLNTARRIVEQHLADGVILSGILSDDPRIAYLCAAGFPFVTLGRSHGPQVHPHVDVDNEWAAHAATVLALEGLAVAVVPSGLMMDEPLDHGQASKSWGSGAPSTPKPATNRSAGFRYRSSGGPARATRPLFGTITRVASVIASTWSCVTKIIVRTNAPPCPTDAVYSKDVLT